VTWAMLLENSDRRLAAFREQLEIEPTAETGREYLQRVHAEFIPPDQGSNVAHARQTMDRR
jgi:hypothetical protein